MIPDPPPTPRLDALLKDEDLTQDSLYGTSAGARALLKCLHTRISKKPGASLQRSEQVPLIYRVPVMKLFGFEVRYMGSEYNLRYLSGFPRYLLRITDDGSTAQPVRGQYGCRVHSAWAFT